MTQERLAPEQHDSLDNVPEPQENPLLCGHGDEAAALAAGYRGGKMHHGIILAGPQGIGKATLAFHLARHILSHPDGAAAPPELARIDPAAPLFRMVANGSHPGVLYLTRPKNDRTKAFRAAVTVDEIRKVSRFLAMTTHDGGYRIVIIDPADDMNTNAANALLKSLEEPPSRSLFILISHSPGGLLPTIRSRCQTVRLQPLADADLSNALAGVGLSVPPEAAATLAARAGGSVREAILLTEYGGLEIAGEIERLAREPAFDVGGAWKIADAVAGRDQATQFAIFNRTLLDLISGCAASAAEQGRLNEAERLAAFWHGATVATAETETYNLDKRQHVFGLMRRLHMTLSD